MENNRNLFVQNPNNLQQFARIRVPLNTKLSDLASIEPTKSVDAISFNNGDLLEKKDFEKTLAELGVQEFSVTKFLIYGQQAYSVELKNESEKNKSEEKPKLLVP